MTSRSDVPQHYRHTLIDANKVMFFDGESSTLKNFNNYTLIMTSNSDKVRILWVW